MTVQQLTAAKSLVQTALTPSDRYANVTSEWLIRELQRINISVDNVDALDILFKFSEEHILYPVAFAKCRRIQI